MWWDVEKATKPTNWLSQSDDCSGCMPKARLALMGKTANKLPLALDARCMCKQPASQNRNATQWDAKDLKDSWVKRG